MTKKILLLILCSPLFIPYSSATAQQTTKIPRVGYLRLIENPVNDEAF